MQLSLEFPSHNVNCGYEIEMASKKHHILAKCYDRKGRLLSAAFNSYQRTHPIQKYFAERVGHQHAHRIYLHAEIAAILKARGKPIYRITIERYDAKGLPAPSAPCPICQEAIKAFGITVVEHF